MKYHTALTPYPPACLRFGRPGQPSEVELLGIVGRDVVFRSRLIPLPGLIHLGLHMDDINICQPMESSGVDQSVMASDETSITSVTMSTRVNGTLGDACKRLSGSLKLGPQGLREIRISSGAKDTRMAAASTNAYPDVFLSPMPSFPDAVGATDDDAPRRP